MTVSLVLGGARSGKSSFAEKYAAKTAMQGLTESQVVFVATAQALDEEMANRIALHQSRRPKHWITVEEPLDIPAVLRRQTQQIVLDESYPVVLIDCLALLLSNWMYVPWNEESCEMNHPGHWLGEVDGITRNVEKEVSENRVDETNLQKRQQALLESLQAYPGQIIIVSNEVGSGIVPADASTRLYRDWLGRLNQAVASISSSVFLVVAGIPVDLRKLETMW